MPKAAPKILSISARRAPPEEKQASGGLPASRVKDPSLAKQGRQKIEWAERSMPVLLSIRERFSREKPLKGVRIAACLHVTKETAVLAETLAAGGAEISLCASNPLSTQDDVAAALAAKGMRVYAWRGVDNKEYYENLNAALDLKPHITLDDGADLMNVLHDKRRDLLPNVFGGQEETTTGVVRLKAMAAAGKLAYPLIAVNNAKTKMMFDNRYGTGHSTIDGIVRATNVLLAGKTFVIAGYGWCGRGLATRARGMGANVIITEIDAVKALEAKMDGFRVSTMADAAPYGDIFVTATGNLHVLRGEHFRLMKDGAIVANTGHFNVEIDVDGLESMKQSKRTVRDNVEEYLLPGGKKIYLLAQGRLVNLACAEGHPSEVMDMSFANQALCSEYLAKNHAKLKKGVYDVPLEIDDLVAKLKLAAFDTAIDTLNPEQIKYLASYEEGT